MGGLIGDKRSRAPDGSTCATRERPRAARRIWMMMREAGWDLGTINVGTCIRNCIFLILVIFFSFPMALSVICRSGRAIV